MVRCGVGAAAGVPVDPLPEVPPPPSGGGCEVSEKQMPLEELKAEVRPAFAPETFVVVMPLLADLIGGLSRERATEIADALNQTMFAAADHARAEGAK